MTPMPRLALRSWSATATALGRRHCISRNFAMISPGKDPLELLRKECLDRKLCDEDGYRIPSVHWVFAAALSKGEKVAPTLRTIGIQRVSNDGIDFVTKQETMPGSSAVPMSVMLSHGRYVPGETAEQWRGEGSCQQVALSELLNYIPEYTKINMIVANRMRTAVASSDDSEDRATVADRSKTTEITQKVRMELEEGSISMEEMEESIQAFRFLPERIERMRSTPDSVTWERWEWTKSDNVWNEPRPLLPH